MDKKHKGNPQINSNMMQKTLSFKNTILISSFLNRMNFKSMNPITIMSTYNHYKVITQLIILLWVMVINIDVKAQKANGTIKELPGRILSFERQDDFNKIRSSSSNIEQSKTISMLGKNSLKWDWRNGSSLEVPLYNFYSEGVRISPFDKDQCLVVWIYNEKASSGAVTFILSGENLENISCKFFLNYIGWRTAHIPLSQMEGKAPQQGDFNTYQWLKMEIPNNHPEKSGRFFIDDVYTTMIDARHPSADFQAPYVKAFFNGSAYVTQWMNQKSLPTKEDMKIKQIPINKTDLEAFEKLYTNEMVALTRGIKGKGLSKKSYESILKQFKSLNIKTVDDGGKFYLQAPYIALKGEGLPKNIITENIESGHFIYVNQFENILHSLAQSYHKSLDKGQKEVLKENFLLVTKAYLQSGWVAGSNMGALHHLGYSTRKIAPSFFIMKEELQEAGLLEEVSASINWYAVAHVVNQDDNSMPDLDLFNTLLYAHYLGSMMRLNKEDAARHVILFSQWLSRTFADQSKHGGFKNDGTAWHHWGHYPAYTNGAIDVAVQITNKLSVAGFPLSLEGHKALQKAVKTILLYSQGNCIPRSLSGRHPLTGSHKKFINSNYTKEFVSLALIDPDLKKLYKYHITNSEFDGHWTLPYSAMNLHRRKDYLISVRGFSIYSWGSEIYNFNRFGRYQSYGTVDILYKSDESLPYEGYDWNLNPGTTITYLPLEDLESPIPIFMVKSLSRFANGVHDKEQKNGAHGIILDESILINIDPEYEEILTKEKLKARKSTFFMDDIILCLGSGISGQNPTAPVYTVLTQQASTAIDHNVVVGKKTIQKFPYANETIGRQMLYNGKNTGYVVLDKDTKLKVSLKEQISRGDECTFDELRKPPRSNKNGKVNLRREPETKGNFFTAVIDHGIQPADARYSYAILAGVDKNEFLTKAQDLLEHPELYYHIISQRNNLHALRDVRNNTETYICYEALDMIPHANLDEVSEPCLLIFKKKEDGIQKVSVALPDLHMTAYSREQKNKAWTSQKHKLILTFDGEWTIESGSPEVFSVTYGDGYTAIAVNAQHGVSNHFVMQMIHKNH